MRKQAPERENHNDGDDKTARFHPSNEEKLSDR
jgi:hypothetical protein